jgi:predicted AlkP superfamily phosphohydrolase/phosphomutase
VPDYNPDPFDPVGASRRQILELEAWMQKHEQVSRSLMERHPSSLSFSVVQALDHLQHLFWNQIAAGSAGQGYEEVEQGEFAALIDRCYALADQIIGHRLAAAAAQQANLFLVSDHGFGPARKWFHVNRLLQERGLLALGTAQGGRLSRSLSGIGLSPQKVRDLVRRADVLGLRRHMGRLARVTLGRRIDSALTLPIDWSRTQAVSGSPATEGVFVNLKGREPGGTVEPGEDYEAVRERLMAELLGLWDPDTGEPVVHAVHRREELYEGPFLDLLPDVVFDLADGPYLASDSQAAERIIEPLPDGTLEGRHRPTGIFAAAGPGIRRGGTVEGVRIIDIAPTVLYALGLPIPEDMDGRPLLEVFREDFRSGHAVVYSEPQEAGTLAPPAESDEEDTAEMERRLRGLGYLS